MQSSINNPLSKIAVFVIMILLIVTIAALVIELTASNQKQTVVTPPAIAADTYLSEINTLLEGADAANGAALVEHYGCIACHRLGVTSHIAPPFVGVAERAVTRRPPLTAAAYIYESITQPTIYVVESFAPAMPQDFAKRLSPRELGDIIAYLLTPDAK